MAMSTCIHFSAANAANATNVADSDEPANFSWWDHEIVDGKIVKTDISVKCSTPVNWDDEEDDAIPTEIHRPPTFIDSLNPIVAPLKQATLEESVIVDEESDSESDSESDDETTIDEVKKKSSKQNDTEKFRTLIDKLGQHITKTKSIIQIQVFAIGKKGYSMQNLSNQQYYIPGYGYIMIFLKKAEAYYYKQGTQKINISRLRNDMDVTKTNLRIAIAKQDTHLQQKMCDKLVEQKKILDNALENISNVKNKNTPLDYVKSAIRIVKRGNERSLHFVNMFRETFAQSSQTEYDEPINETRTIQVKKEEKKPSVFARKTLTL